MALSLNIELTRSRGIFSSHRLQEYLMRDPSDPSRWIADTSKSQLSWDDIYKVFFGAANYNEITGNHFGGSGVDFSVLITLLGPCCVYLVFFMALRFALREPLARLGMSMGVVTEDEELHKKLLASGKKGTNALSQRNQKRIFKFQNQVWLFLFYSGSATFGWYVQRDKPWFTLPMNDTSALHMLLPHPYNPSPVLIFYYQYGLAFYTSELISLMFLEKDVKRSDYMEYFLHHLVTLALMVLSHVGWLHRFGVYVLFIHDASDIMLSLSKALHYVVEENNNKSAKSKHQGCTKSFIFKYLVNIALVNFCMVLFVISFFYFRLWCLPSMVRADVFTMPLVINCNYNTVGLTLLLNGLLQALHIYWAALIIKVFLGMFYGVRKDVRSASEEEVEEPNYVLWNGASPIGAQSNSLD